MLSVIQWHPLARREQLQVMGKACLGGGGCYSFVDPSHAGTLIARCCHPASPHVSRWCLLLGPTSGRCARHVRCLAYPQREGTIYRPYNQLPQAATRAHVLALVTPLVTQHSCSAFCSCGHCIAMVGTGCLQWFCSGAGVHDC